MKKLLLLGTLFSALSFATTFACVSNKVVIPNYSEKKAEGEYILAFDQRDGQNYISLIYQKDKLDGREKDGIFKAYYVGKKEISGEAYDIFETSSGVYYYMPVGKENMDAFIVVEINKIETQNVKIPVWIQYYCADVKKLGKK